MSSWRAQEQRYFQVLTLYLTSSLPLPEGWAGSAVDRTLGHFHHVPIFVLGFPEIQFTCILWSTLGAPKWDLSPSRLFMYFNFPQACYKFHPSHSAWFNLPYDVWCGADMEFLIMLIFRFSVIMFIPPSVRCVPACPHELPLHGFSWNLILKYFSKICRENSSFIKIWQV
jgi:hypothetical protein